MLRVKREFVYQDRTWVVGDAFDPAGVPPRLLQQLVSANKLYDPAMPKSRQLQPDRGAEVAAVVAANTKRRKVA